MMKSATCNKTFCLLLICFAAFSAVKIQAFEHGTAVREIVAWQNLPSAFSLNPGVYAKSFSMQTLTRYWQNHQFSQLKLKTAFELSHLYSQNNVKAGFAASNPAKSKAFKTSSRLLDSPRTRIDFEIERFELSFSRGDLDFQIGRQPISLGTSHFISVLDVVAPFHPGYLDSSYKPGVDALRIRGLAGETGEMELIGIAGERSNQGAIIGRYRNTFSEFDVELIAGQFRNRKFFGVGWEGERKEINIWGEAALFERKNQLDPNLGGFSDKVAFSFIAGMEKDMGKDWRGGLSYFHQDFGATRANKLPMVYSSSPFQEGWVHLGGRSYLLMAVNREMNPLTRLSINGMLNLNDHSTLWQPVLSVSTGDESDIAIYAWLKTGKMPTANISGINLMSEFGSFSSGAGFIYRRYF